MAVIEDIVSGWTGVLGPFTLRVDGVPQDLTGMTVALIMHNEVGDLVTPGGTITPDPDQATNPGQVTYAPVATDFVLVSGGNPMKQQYWLHWRVTDVSDKSVKFPNGEADRIVVWRE